MWSHFLRLHNLLALTDNMYVGAEDENTETGTRDAQNVNDLLDVYCYEELEDIISWLVDGNNTPHIHTIDPSESEQYANDRIEFIPPYTRCNRIDDYKRAWYFFEDKIK